jgi:hypothetical protein
VKVDFIEIYKKGVNHKHRFVLLTDSMLIIYDESAVEEPDQPKHFKAEKQFYLLDQCEITNGKDQMREIMIKSGTRECTLVCRSIEHKNEWLKTIGQLKVKSCVKHV